MAGKNLTAPATAPCFVFSAFQFFQIKFLEENNFIEKNSVIRFPQILRYFFQFHKENLE